MPKTANLKQDLEDVSILPEIEVKVKAEKTFSDLEIFNAVTALRDKVTNEMNRRKKAGEKFNQLRIVVGNFAVLIQNIRKLQSGGYSPRIAR